MPSMACVEWAVCSAWRLYPIALPRLADYAGEVAQRIIDDQIKKLEPRIGEMVKKEAEWGLAAYNRWGSQIKLYINVTLDVQITRHL